MKLTEMPTARGSLVTLALLLPALGVAQPDCAPRGAASATVAFHSDTLAAAGMLPGDRLRLYWLDSCAGESEVYAGESLALPGNLLDTIDPDPRQWPPGEAARVEVLRDGALLETTTTAHNPGGPERPQPWAYAGEQLLIVDAFEVLLPTPSEDSGGGVLSAARPNPSRGVLRLPGVTGWLVYDALGRPVLRGTGSRLDLRSLRPGVYFVRSAGAVHPVTIAR